MVSSRVSPILSSNGEIADKSIQSVPSISPLRDQQDSPTNPIRVSNVRPTEKHPSSAPVSTEVDPRRKESEYILNAREQPTTKPSVSFSASTHLRFSATPANPVTANPTVTAAAITHSVDPVSTTEKEDVTFVSQGTYVYCSFPMPDSSGFTIFRSS